jgi:hypothetical protein
MMLLRSRTNGGSESGSGGTVENVQEATSAQATVSVLWRLAGAESHTSFEYGGRETRVRERD